MQLWIDYCRYKYHGAGLASTWVSAQRFALVDLGAGPCLFCRMGISKGMVCVHGFICLPAWASPNIWKEVKVHEQGFVDFLYNAKFMSTLIGSGIIIIGFCCCPTCLYCVTYNESRFLKSHTMFVGFSQACALSCRMWLINWYSLAKFQLGRGSEMQVAFCGSNLPQRKCALDINELFTQAYVFAGSPLSIPTIGNSFIQVWGEPDFKRWHI